MTLYKYETAKKKIHTDNEEAKKSNNFVVF